MGDLPGLLTFITGLIIFKIYVFTDVNSKLEVSIAFLFLELNEPQREGRKAVWVRENGRHWTSTIHRIQKQGSSAGHEGFHTRSFVYMYVCYLGVFVDH